LATLHELAPSEYGVVSNKPIGVQCIQTGYNCMLYVGPVVQLIENNFISFTSVRLCRNSG